MQIHFLRLTPLPCPDSLCPNSFKTFVQPADIFWVMERCYLTQYRNKWVNEWIRNLTEEKNKCTNVRYAHRQLYLLVYISCKFKRECPSSALIFLCLLTFFKLCTNFKAERSSCDLCVRIHACHYLSLRMYHKYTMHVIYEIYNSATKRKEKSCRGFYFGTQQDSFCIWAVWNESKMV